MAEIPEELIVETLLRLPVKSLLRFRCLSKPLGAVISSPNFINSHLSKSSQTSNLRKLILQEGKRMKGFHVYDVNLDLEDEILPLENPFSSSLLQSICGYCNGLVLLCRYDPFELALWNPSTRHSRDLPECPFQIQKKGDMRFGLGYDDSIDGYKAVFIVRLENSLEFEFQVWIYELKSNIWRKAQNFPYFCKWIDFRIDFPKIGYFTDGSLHWLIPIDSSNGRLEIVAFDMKRETFSLVPQPVSPISTISKLHVLEECLCISYFSLSTGSHNQVDLYTRKKDGVGNFTWKILYSVKDPVLHDLFESDFLNLLGYLKRSGKIMVRLDTGCMVLYDVEDNNFVKVGIENVRDRRWPVLCLESLVSVGE